jgi:hypothetical protein
MDDQTAEALAAHPRWEWRDGMLTTRDSYISVGRYAGADDIGLYFTTRTGQRYLVTRNELAGAIVGVIPDLDDDATAGILLGMVREWCDERGRRLEVECIGRKQWRVCSRRDVWAEWARTDGTGESMGEAAGRCLLACWAVDAADGNDKHNTGHRPDGATE